MTPIILLRRAQPLVASDTPRPQWRLTDKGQNDARALGARLRIIGSTPPTTVLVSPERRARDTSALAFPSSEVTARDELREIEKPWYASTDEHNQAAARYLRHEEVVGWEGHEDVTERMARLSEELAPSSGHVLVSHGLFLTTWLDHEVGLDDPVSFWSDLRMPDAWEVDLETKSFERIG